MGIPDQETLESWSPARLISVAGIRGKKEQEQRATSALLATMAVVPSFGHSLLKTVGAPAGRISTFVEPHFETDEGGTAIPDGAVVVRRGKTEWLCLVEVKTGSTELDSDQVNRYLSIANREGFDALLTISNQIVGEGSETPVAIDRRKTKRLRLGHISWFRILTEAIIQHEHRGVDDPEQAFVLADLIAYLDDSISGAGGFDGMGKEWVTIRDAARNKTLRARDAGVTEVVQDWEQFVEYPDASGAVPDVAPGEVDLRRHTPGSVVGPPQIGRLEPRRTLHRLGDVGDRPFEQVEIAARNVHLRHRGRGAGSAASAPQP